MKRRRRKVTIERERVLVVAPGPRSKEGWCVACGSEVRLVGTEEAAALSGLSLRALFRKVEAGRLHFSETSGGALLICLDSLLKETGSAEVEEGRAHQLNRLRPETTVSNLQGEKDDE